MRGAPKSLNPAALSLLSKITKDSLERAKAVDQKVYPNTIEGDRMARDEGALGERGLAGYLDDLDPSDRSVSTESFLLIQRAAAIYGIHLADEEKYRAIVAIDGKLYKLLMFLVRDHLRAIYDIGPDAGMPSHKKIALVDLVDFIRVRDNLATDVLALSKAKLFADYKDYPIDQLRKYLSAGRKLLGRARGRGHPRKLAAKGQNKVY